MAIQARRSCRQCQQAPGGGQVAGGRLLAITVEAAEELDPGVEINAVIE
jgi:hypothetical protein